MRKKTISDTITVDDLDRAIKAGDRDGWQTCNCLIAQFAIRLQIVNYMYEITAQNPEANKLMTFFDATYSFGPRSDPHARGRLAMIAKMRAMLPLPITVEVRQ